jgi:hypothetical protein
VDAHAPAGADHAAGDLAPVGYQYAFNHAGTFTLGGVANPLKLTDCAMLAVVGHSNGQAWAR